MSYAAALAVVALAILAPAAFAWAVSVRLPHEQRRRFHEIGIAVFLQLGVVYAVLLAFVFNQVWEQFGEAQHAVDIECTDLQGVANRAALLPASEAIAIRASLHAYLESELVDEWPAMARRQRSPATSLAFTRLFGTVAGIPPGSPLASGTRDTMLRLLESAQRSRQLRLFQLKTNVPGFLWGLLIAFAAVLTGFVLLAGVGHSLVQAGLVGCFAALLTAIMLTIHLMDYPFEGSIRVSPEPVETALHALNDIPLAAPSPAGR